MNLIKKHDPNAFIRWFLGKLGGLFFWLYPDKVEIRILKRPIGPRVSAYSQGFLNVEQRKYDFYDNHQDIVLQERYWGKDPIKQND
jgi:hypothetical protein